jgi:thiol-disulfide isomerase/thioredoxin
MTAPTARFLGLALLVLVFAWAGTRMYLASHALPTAIRVPAGQASPPTASDIVSEAPAVKIPDRLPDFSLNNLNGTSTPIRQFGGQALVINFWATWCAPCREEIPLLQRLAKSWAGKGVTVIGVAVDYPDKVREFAAQFHIDYPILVGEQEGLDLAAQFGVSTPVFPFTVFTDQSGEVVALFVGQLHPSQAQLILATVKRLNEKQLKLMEAREAIAEGLEALSRKASG